MTVCYHTIYASPWIFPPLAFYGFDLLLRMFRYRIKDATLVPVDSNMTLVRFKFRYTPCWVSNVFYRYMSMTVRTGGSPVSMSACACSSPDASLSPTLSRL